MNNKALINVFRSLLKMDLNIRKRNGVIKAIKIYSNRALTDVIIMNMRAK